MSDTPTAPLSGRRADASCTDQRILGSSRAVFLADPDAPISAGAKHAGVGIGAVYRRYSGTPPNRQETSGHSNRGATWPRF